MPRLLWIFSLSLCLWPGLALGQILSANTQDKQPSDAQDTRPCISKEAAQEVLRLGRSLGYADDEVVQAYGENACATLSSLRNEVQKRAQRNFSAQTSTEQTVKTGYVKCQPGATEVSVWLAPGDLTVVASTVCGESLDVLQDGELWMRVRTEAGAVGYLPRAAVADKLDSGPKGPQVVPTTTTTPAPPAESTSSQGALSCDKVVSFALVDASGVHPFMGTGNWIGNWVRKNAKKHPDICFSETPMRGRKNYLIALSQSSGYLTGFDPVVRTNTSTSTSPVSGSGTITDNYGDMWYYTYNGTVTTTTTTTTTENVPYTINSNTLFANAYDERGTLVSQHNHVYSTKSGGDAANSLGYNLGNALVAINARGRLLGSVVKDIEGKKKK